MKRNLYFLASGAFSLLLLSSCSTPQQVVYSVTGGNEILNSLSKITESDKTTAQSVSGYKDNGIVFSLYDSKAGYTSEYANIYKKENPLSPSMSQVTSGNNFNYSPVYNEEIEKIAFSRYVDGGGSRDIYMISASNGTALVPATDTANGNEWYPSLSTDGTIMAYEKTPRGTGGLNVDAEIWIKNLKTGETMLLSNGFCPKISPDGKKIAYAKVGNTTDVCHIWVMNIDGSDAMQLTTGDDELALNPAWSPDGTKIIFQARKGNAKNNDVNLYVMNPDGTSLSQLTNNPSFDGDPYWSKDHYIYFISDRGSKKGDYQIWRFQYFGY